MAAASRPCSTTSGGSRRSISANASSHVAGASCPSAPRTIGARRRSGSSCSAFSATPLGQMNPCEKTSSASPRTLTSSSPSSVSSRPQVASQKGQVRKSARATAFDPTCPLGPVALLELLARAAPARVVAADLLVLVDDALLDNRGLDRLVGVDAVAVPAVGAGLVVERAPRVGERRPARRAAGALGGGERLALPVLALRLDLDVVDHAREVRPDRVHEVLEEREALVLVRHERVDLGEAAEVDALAQVVHVVEVLAPALVDDLE